LIVQEVTLPAQHSNVVTLPVLSLIFLVVLIIESCKGTSQFMHFLYVYFCANQKCHAIKTPWFPRDACYVICM
jgi:hypothetical protein